MLYARTWWRIRSASLAFTFILFHFSGWLAVGEVTCFVVKNNPAAQHPYTNWASAAPDIQTAVDASSDGDTVVVSNGVYNTGGVAGYPDGGELTNRVAIHKPITVRSANGPDVTSIVGSGPKGAQAVRGVYLVEGAALVGFTVTQGATSTNEGGGLLSIVGTDLGDAARGAIPKSSQKDQGSFFDQVGGGIFAAGAGAIVSNCIISGNAAADMGGGVYYGSLYNCVLSGNSVSGSFNAMGGGAYSATIHHSTLEGNTVEGDSAGGGAAAFSALFFCTLNSNAVQGVWMGQGGGAYESELHHCVLRGNSASGENAFGGAVSAGTLRNCLLWGNEASGIAAAGGAVFDSELTSCTVVGNRAGFGGGVYGAVLENSIVFYNTASESGTNYEDAMLINSCADPAPAAPEDGGGNIADAPLFKDAGSGFGLQYQTGDCRLQSDSPCINAGTNQDWMAGAPDLDGNPRILEGVVDIGACEFDVLAPVIMNLVAPSNDGVLESFTSEYGSSYAAARVTDEQVNTYWLSARYPAPTQAFVYGFAEGKIAKLQNAVIYNSSPYYSRDFRIETSGDGESWTTVVAGSLASTTVAQEFDLSGVSARKVRLVITSGSGSTYWSLREFEVYGHIPPVTDSGIPLEWLIRYGLPTDGSVDHEDAGDGFTVLEHYIADTDPTDPNNFLHVRVAGRDAAPAPGIAICWPSATGRVYTVSRTTNLLQEFVTLDADVPADPPENTYVDTTATAEGSFFYRICARLAE